MFGAAASLEQGICQLIGSWNLRGSAGCRIMSANNLRRTVTIQFRLYADHLHIQVCVASASLLIPHSLSSPLFVYHHVPMFISLSTHPQ